MYKLVKISAVLVVFALLALPVLGYTGNSDIMRGKAADMMKRGQEIRSAAGMMGMGFMHKEGSNFGQYVTFNVTATGEVTDYSIAGIPVFDNITVANFDYKGSPQYLGKFGELTRISNKNDTVVLQLHDNPAAVINIRTKIATTITFNLAAGVTASQQDKIIKIEADNLTAYITGTNATSISMPNNATITIQSNAGNAVFRAVPVNMPFSKGHEKFMKEVMENRAGAEIDIGDYDKYSIVNYSDNIDVMVKSVESHHVNMTISSTNPSGRFFMMDIDNSSLSWTPGQRINLYIDNQPMKQVMDVDDLYNATESSFYLDIAGGNRVQVSVYIANFSDHTLDIAVEQGTPTPTVYLPLTSTQTPTGTTGATATPGAPGFELALVLLGGGLAYYLRRKY